MCFSNMATAPVQAGNKDTALAKLAEPGDLIKAAGEAMKQHSKGKIVNAKCPKIGNPIDPAKDTDKLTRYYKGKKVGFCCAGCPTAWDKLTDVEKETKLSKVLISKGKSKLKKKTSK